MQQTRTKLVVGVLDGFDLLRSSIAWNHGRIMYGFNIDVRDSGCRFIIKTFTKGRAEICFINASTIERCLEVLEAHLYSNANVGVKWKPDKYYTEK